MKHHLKVEIKAEDTQSLERQLKELVETCNINLALACKCGGYDFSEKAGEDQTILSWRCTATSIAATINEDEPIAMRWGDD